MAAVNATYFFTPLVLMLVPEHCHDEFFVKFNFLDVPCLKVAFTKALGYGIVVGASIVKVPQIMKLLAAKSAAGLSVTALYAELAAITFTMAYSIQMDFPFSAWGESLFLSLQNVILVMMIYMFCGQTLGLLLFAPLYAGVSYALCTSITPLDVVTKLQGSVLVIMLVSKFIQIFASFQAGNTGQLSFITAFLLFAGSVARIFTTIQETGDMLMTSQFILAGALNAVILGQILWYWNVGDKLKKTE